MHSHLHKCLTAYQNLACVDFCKLRRMSTVVVTEPFLHSPHYLYFFHCSVTCTIIVFLQTVAITLTASNEAVMESEPLTITCTVTNGATGMVILRIDGNPIMNSTITDSTQSAVTFVTNEVSRYIHDGISNCFMAQCTLEEDGSNPVVINVVPG